MIKVWDRQALVDLWDAGYSASRIKAKLGLDVTVRQIQRIGADYGNRTKRYRELQSGRVRADQEFIGGLYRPIIEALMIERGHDPHVCDLCGKPSDKKMTIHHTKYEGATISDLVFSCTSCQHQYANHGLA